MEYKVNSETDDFKVILFEFENSNWEIIVNKDDDDNLIKLAIYKRMDELDEDFIKWGSNQYSDLIVDYTTQKEI